MSPILHNSLAAALASRRKTQARQPIPKGGRVPGARKIVADQLPGFSRKLAAMLSAGMPIVSSLKALENQTRHPAFKAVITRVKKGIEEGQILSESFSSYSDVFDDLYVNMVKSGESGGQLPETMARLAGFLESSQRLKRKVKSAMIYPTVVMSVALMISAAMIAFIVPVFADMFKEFGRDLPVPTQFLLDVSSCMRSNGITILSAMVLVIASFKKWKASPGGAYQFDRFVMGVPVFGDLNRKVASARFARTLSQMLKSGVPILNALEIVSGATGNRVACSLVMGFRRTVELGEPLSSAMHSQTVFPSMLVEMLEAGEKAGKIDDMMDCIADFYDDEVEVMLDGLTSLLEPLLMVALGIIIGGIVICMFLPIFRMTTIIN